MLSKNSMFDLSLPLDKGFKFKLLKVLNAGGY